MKTADLFDQNEHLVRVCSTQFIHFGQKESCFGQVHTVKCFEDNSLIKQALSQNGLGKVLIVDGGSSLRTALMGDIIAASAVTNNWGGVIILGAIRDSEAIDRLPLHVKALGTTPKKSTKLDLGQLSIPLNIEGTEVNPNDWVYSDADGVLFSEKQLPL